MSTPSWFHGRLSSVCRRFQEGGGFRVATGFAKNRVGIRFGFDTGAGFLTGLAFTSTETGTFTQDPVTGAGTYTGTDTLQQSGFAVSPIPGVLIFQGLVEPPANDFVGLGVGPGQHVSLWWWREGDIVCQPWSFKPTSPGGGFWVIETLLIEGTIDDYVRYCRSNE